MQLTVLGRYELVERLAIGGMAELFLARQRGDGGFAKLLVIKRVLPHLAADATFVKMFLDEARLAARLNHPALTQVFDLGKAGDDYYLAMEYLAGEDLRKVMTLAEESPARRLPAALAAWIVARAAEGLHFAHEARDDSGRPLGIVHRDISPSNIFLTYQGAVKVLDFGVALARGRLQQTEAGLVRGKLSYMSPEQASGEALDRRADVWALGVCLWELLTGQRLFSGSHAVLFEQILSARVANPTTVCDEVPPELAAIALRCLARLPEDRFQTADELRDAIDDYLAVHTSAPWSMQLASFLTATLGEAQRERRLAPLKNTVATLSQTAPSTRRTSAIIGVLTVSLLGVGVVVGWLRAQPSLVAPVDAPRPLEPPALHAEVVDAGTDVVVASEPAPPPVTPPAKSPSPVDAGAPRPEAHRPRQVRVSVQANVPGTLRIDGRIIGPLPVKGAMVAPGRHAFRIENPQLGVRYDWAPVLTGESQPFTMTVGQGRLNVAVDPWAEVWVDGRQWSQTPVSRELWEGTHTVRLVRGTREKSLTVEVKQGDTTVVTETLK